MEEHRSLERVLGFTLFQLARGAPALLGIFDPVEGEQRAFDAADLAQRGVPVPLLPRVPGVWPCQKDLV